MRVVIGGHYLPEECPAVVTQVIRQMTASRLRAATEVLDGFAIGKSMT